MTFWEAKQKWASKCVDRLPQNRRTCRDNNAAIRQNVTWLHTGLNLASVEKCYIECICRRTDVTVELSKRRKVTARAVRRDKLTQPAKIRLYPGYARTWIITNHHALNKCCISRYIWFLVLVRMSWRIWANKYLVGAVQSISAPKGYSRLPFKFPLSPPKKVET